MDEGAASAPPVAHVRPVRSFVRREGRMTEAQKRALDELWPRFGVPDPAAPLDSMALFGREAPLTVEIGFGDGDHLLGRAQQEPARNFLGVEVHRPGIGRLLLRAQAVGLRNLRVAAHDAVEVLRDAIRPGQVDELLIYFPDPWPKKRHHKRRLVQPAFAALAAARLASGGMLRLATDWAPYAEHMRAVLDAEPALQNAAAGFSDRGARPATKFERRGVRLGHAVFDLAYRRVG